MQDINTINTGLCQAGRQASDQKVNTGGQTRGTKYQSTPGSRQGKRWLRKSAKQGRYVCVQRGASRLVDRELRHFKSQAWKPLFQADITFF